MVNHRWRKRTVFMRSAFLRSFVLRCIPLRIPTCSGVRRMFFMRRLYSVNTKVKPILRGNLVIQYGKNIDVCNFPHSNLERPFRAILTADPNTFLETDKQIRKNANLVREVHFCWASENRSAMSSGNFIWPLNRETNFGWV